MIAVSAIIHARDASADFPRLGLPPHHPDFWDLVLTWLKRDGTYIEIAGPAIVASADSEDIYKSVDLLADKLDGFLRRRHGMLKEKRHHPHAFELDVELPKAT